MTGGGDEAPGVAPRIGAEGIGAAGFQTPAPRAVFLHGFGQTGRCGGPLLDKLATQLNWVTPDLPGHAGRPPPKGSFEVEAGALVEAHGPAWFVGYSMGGRLALAGALGRPEWVRGLVLIGVSPGLDDAAARGARRQEEATWRRRLEEEGLERFFSAWLAGPLFSTLPREARFEAERQRHDPRALGRSVEALGVGSMAPVGARLSQLARPVLLVAGALDAKFVALHRAMAAQLADAQVVEVPGAGHAAHLERPDAVAEAITRWLQARGVARDRP